MTASANPDFARRLFGAIAPEYERMGALMSLGREAGWRRFLVSRLPPADHILDVASGTGLIARELARAGWGRVTALDQSPEMLAQAARANTAADLAGRIEPVHGAADALPFDDATFDAVSFSYLLRYVPDPEATLTELARVLRPGGRMAALEFHVPSDLLARLGWRAYTRFGLPALGAIASPAWRDTGRFLGPNIEDWRRRWPLRRQARAWRAAGFVDLGARRLTLGAAAVTWGRKRE